MGIITVLAAVIIMSVLALFVPAAIGIFVYRDSTVRGMNPFLWTLLAVFAPGYIGFVVYLIARSEYSPYTCPQCGEHVQKVYTSCPHCGYPLKSRCPYCSAPIEPTWNVCPCCSKEIPDELKIKDPAKPASEKHARRLIIALIAVPVVMLLLVILLAFAFYAFPSSNVITESGYDIAEAAMRLPYLISA